MSSATDINRFAVRVYAFITHPDARILLSSEEYKNDVFKKLPGGGLEYGESIPDGLSRELHEELGLRISIERLEHFYTCDFLVVNQFNPKDQVIGVYYTLELAESEIEQVNAILSVSQVDGQMTHIGKEWLKPADIKNRLTFPMDRKAADVYLEKYG